MMKVVQDDDTGKFPNGRTLTLVGDVGQVLPQLLARLVVNIKGSNQTCCQLLARPMEKEMQNMLHVDDRNHNRTTSQ